MCLSLLSILWLYGVLAAVVITLVTGLLLHALTVFYYNREVDFWAQHYIDLCIKLTTRGDNRDPLEVAAEAREWAKIYVLEIRRSPVGLVRGSAMDEAAET